MISNLIRKVRGILGSPKSQKELQKELRQKGVIIGSDCRIFSKIDGPEAYLITLGDNVTIATGVRLITHDNSISKVWPQFTDIFGRIIIGNNCFIGAFSTILCGVKIGDNSIVGAGSVVVTSIPAGEIWGGVPAKKIGDVKNFKFKSEKYGLNVRGMTYEEKKSLLLSTDRLIEK